MFCLVYSLVEVFGFCGFIGFVLVFLLVFLFGIDEIVWKGFEVVVVILVGKCWKVLIGVVWCILFVIKGFVLVVFSDCLVEELVVVDWGGWIEFVEVINGVCFVIVGLVGEVLWEVFFGDFWRMVGDVFCEVFFEIICEVFLEVFVGGGFVIIGDVVFDEVLGVLVLCEWVVCVVFCVIFWEIGGDVEVDIWVVFFLCL